MNECFNCGHELIWQNDFTFSDYGYEDEEGIVTIWDCPNCGATHEVWIPEGRNDEQRTAP